MLTVRLHNPLLPILLLLEGAGDTSARACLIPFPSLYRGGWHASEAVAAAVDGGCAIGDLSEHLVNRLLETACGPLAISKVVVDGRGTLQTEPVFNSWIREWLVRVMRVSVEITGGPDQEMAQLLVREEKDREAPVARDADGYILDLPGDHLPTIASLVWRTPALRATAEAGSFIVADQSTFSITATVDLPAEIAIDRNMLDTGRVAGSWPGLRNQAATETGDQATHPTGYLSISFRSETLDNASLLLRSAPDLSEPILQRAAPHASDIHVRLHHTGSRADLRNCLFSLSQQTRAGALFITVLSRDREILPDDIILGQSLFGSRIAFSDTEMAGIPSLAGSDSKYAILLLGDSITLQDHRTIETLETLADPACVASSSCLLVGQAENGKNMCVVSSGYFYDPQAKEIGIRNLFGALPYANYPVVCGHPALTFIPSHAQQLLANACEQANLREIWQDFVIKSYIGNHIHLTTSMISAVVKTDMIPPDLAINRLPAASYERLPQARMIRS